ncbi:MAG: aminotransferase class IV [Tissierellales bacterium]|jgi:branched-chain amino acid aminotransferase|nr:aminotransferase class IV [Tissierellales bacterium]
MREIRGKYIIQDGNIILAENAEIMLDGSFYEVIRIYDGKFLFLNEHIERLEKSIIGAGYECPFDKEYLLELVNRLKQSLSILNQNIKIVVEIENAKRISIYAIESKYPEKELYEMGVAVDCLNIKRDNPEIKLWNQNYKNIVNKVVKEKELFEVLLVDDDGTITEGSKSNVFFIKGDVVYTASTKKVLNGITRQKVIEAIKNANIVIEEIDVGVKDIKDIDAAFLTGTSLNILPISRIGDKMFEYSVQTKRLMEKLKKAYEQILHE